MKRAFILFIVCFPFIGASQSAQPDTLQAYLVSKQFDSIQFDRLNEKVSDLLKDNPTAARELSNALINSPITYPKGKARSLTLLGNTYWNEGIYELALHNYLSSARMYHEVNDSLGLSRTYNNIGEVYKKLKEYEKSLDYLTQSLALKKNKGPISLYNIGELYFFMHNYPKANQYFQESLDMAIDMKEGRAIAYCYWGIGKIKAIEKKYDQALGLFNQSLRAWNDIGDVRSIIQLHQEIAQLFRIQNKFEAASHQLNIAEKLSATQRVPDLTLKNYYLAFTIDSAQGNMQNALSHLYEYNQLKDSIYNLQKAEQITRIQTLYETEIRERENQELRYEKDLKNSQLRTQQIFIVITSLGLFLMVIMSTLLYRQQKQILRSNRELTIKNEKINDQHEAIQQQAAELTKLNEKLKDLNLTLEHRIEERTKQLHLQNQKLTEYTFINVHKLRSPLASILGLINLMNQLPVEEIPQALGYLKNCSEHLDDIIRDFNVDLESGIMKEKD